MARRSIALVAQQRNAPVAREVGQLSRGRALWKLGGRTAVVQHVLGPSEMEIVDTDARMQGSTGSGAEAA